MTSTYLTSENADLSNLADLIRAGSALGLEPAAGELPLDFAVRIARAFERRRNNRRWGLAARIVITVGLASFGITTF